MYLFSTWIIGFFNVLTYFVTNQQQAVEHSELYAWLISAIIIVLSVAAYFWRLHGIEGKNKELHELNTRLLKEVEERKNIEADLIVSRTRFSQLAHATFEAILIIDKEKIVEVNESAIDLFGHKREKLIGMSLTDLVIPGENSKNKWEKKKLIPGQYKAIGKKKDESQFFIEISSKEINYLGTPLLVAAIKDITDQVEADKQKEALENQLRQVQKMEAIGSLAGGIAHDFNNLLTIISGFSEMASLKVKKEDPAYYDVVQVLSTARKASQLTRQLLAFSRKQTYQPIVLDVNSLITDLEKMISRLIPVDMTLEKNLENDLPMILADPGQIEQILVNLIVNARDAINAKPLNDHNNKIIIGTKNVVLDKAFVEKNIGSKIGEHVCINITDTGAGIPGNILEKIYEPFFTTKPEGQGTGLGLSTVYGIVKQNNASIHAESREEGGTIFSIYWPSTQGLVETFEAEQTPEMKNNTETILLVDDEEGVLDFAAASLEAFGYKVIKASNGPEALDLIEKVSTKFELVVSDLNMPGMNGHELTNKILESHPKLKVLIISGYGDEFSSKQGRIDNETNFLQKPFSIKKLVNKVQDILNRN